MKQVATPQEASHQLQVKEQQQHGSRLGPLLCWAVVFADVGTSVYYVPGILYGNVGSLAGFFVMLTMSVFVLLTLKYAEVTHRFPQGAAWSRWLPRPSITGWEPSVGCSSWSTTSSRLPSAAFRGCCI